jgi:predicted membrane channel-forming protein YqfA (hemolysin III family)
LFYSNPEDIDTETKGGPWMLGGAFYIGGALLYVFRFPEKIFPRTFDKFGSSH